MVELKTPGRYRRQTSSRATVALLADDDVLVCFQRAALEEARALRPAIRTVQHVGFGVSIRAARDAWAAGFSDAPRHAPRASRPRSRSASCRSSTP